MKCELCGNKGYIVEYIIEYNGGESAGEFAGAEQVECPDCVIRWQLEIDGFYEVKE